MSGEKWRDRVARIERDQNINPGEAVRVANAEIRFEKAKAARLAEHASQQEEPTS